MAKPGQGRRTPNSRMRDVNGNNTGNSNRGNTNSNDDDGDTGFGDTLGPLHEGHLRIGFQNIGGLSSNNTEQDKLLQHFIQSNSFDVFGITEINLYWPALREELQFGERMNQRFNPRDSRKKLCLQPSPAEPPTQLGRPIWGHSYDFTAESSHQTPC